MIEIGGTKINPSKVICLGLNYLDHIKETNRQVPEEPVLFTKTINCLITNNEPIIYPKILFNNKKLNRVDPEVELAFIIKDKCKWVSKEDAFDHILGYTIFNDITARKMQRNDIAIHKPWFRSKSLDTFGPMGPQIVDLDDPTNLDLELKVNGEVRQKSNTRHLLFDVPYLVEYISQFFTLLPGDIIATGTPSGIAPIYPGDILEATIENIGTLKNKVILEE